MTTLAVFVYELERRMSLERSAKTLMALIENAQIEARDSKTLLDSRDALSWARLRILLDFVRRGSHIVALCREIDALLKKQDAHFDRTEAHELRTALTSAMAEMNKEAHEYLFEAWLAVDLWRRLYRTCDERLVLAGLE